MRAHGTATVGGQTNWSQEARLGTQTANSSRKVMTWAMGPSSLLWYMAPGAGSQQFDAGHSEIRAGFLPEGLHQWGDFHFKCLPHGPYPFLPACCFAYLLQCTGVGHKPVWLPHTLCHFSLGHELSDVEDSWGGWANILPSNLDTPSPCHKEVLGQ